MPIARKLRDLYDKPLEPNPSWISGAVLPKGGITLLGGPAKIGKTFLQLGLANVVTGGGALWGTEYTVEQRGRVLIAEREIGEYELQRRAQMLYGATGRPPSDDIYYMSNTPGLYLDTQNGIAILRREVEDTGADVVIIDPISMAMMGEENSNTEVQRLFHNLKDMIADKPHLGIVLVHHFGKPPRGRDAADYDPLDPYNFRGAGKWYDAPDTIITFERTEKLKDGEWWRLNSKWKMRRGPEPAESIIKLAILEGGIVQKAASLKPQTGVAPKRGWGK